MEITGDTVYSPSNGPPSSRYFAIFGPTHSNKDLSRGGGGGVGGGVSGRDEGGCAVANRVVSGLAGQQINALMNEKGLRPPIGVTEDHLRSFLSLSLLFFHS